MSVKQAIKKHTVYSKAPIVEAIFDIQVSLEHEISSEEFLKAHGTIKTEFPIVNTTYFISGQIKVDPEKPQFTSDGNSIPIGKMFSNSEKKRHIQMRSNGYTYNMQAPYTKWEDFVGAAFRYFKFYNTVVGIKSIDKIALRYINQIQIPLPLPENSLNAYMKCVPHIPEGFPNNLRGFFNQIQIAQETDVSVTITQAIMPEKGQFLPFILDIEASKFAGNVNDHDSLMASFEKLRDLKNQAFENCITDLTRELFKSK